MKNKLSSKKKTTTSKKDQSAKRKAEILKIYVTLVKRLKNHPSESQLQAKGITRNAIRHNYGTPADLRVIARKKNPEIFAHIIDETVFNPLNFKKLRIEKNKYKRVVITSAVAGAKPHKKFYNALQTYCKAENALLLVIPVKAPASNLPGNTNLSMWHLDPYFGERWDNGEFQVCFGDLALNTNLYVSGIKLSAKQIDPTTGMDRLGSKYSFIYGSPKQRFKPLPNTKDKIPHVAMGTGAMTKPEYKTESYMSQRTSYLAGLDHKVGAIVVELDGKDLFYFRQLQAEPASGNFVDLGKYYKNDGTIGTMKTSAFVLGDWHAGETDPQARKVWAEVAKELKPEYIVLHDLFNGKSISHHEWKNIIKRTQLAEQNLLSLEDELKVTAKDLTVDLTKWATKKCIVVDSNHDDFLDRYLSDANRFSKDPHNYSIAIELASKMIKGRDPVQEGVEKFLSPAVKKRIKWLNSDESFIIAGIECGQHGHRGPGGSRGTLANHEKAYNSCSIGHSHTPGILREAWQVGTSGILDQGFNKGASSWMHCSSPIYANGARQLIFSIHGKWRLK